MTPASRRRLTTLAIIVLWLGAMAWLVFFEAYPELLNRATSGYHSVLSRGIMVMDRWMIISHQGVPIGYTHTSMDVVENDKVRQYQMSNRTLLTLTVMGRRQRIVVSADCEVDALYNLQTFSFSLSSSGYSILVDGHRIKGNDFAVKIRAPGSNQRLTVSIPPDAVLYSPMTEMSLKSLTPGRQMTLKVFNPVTLTSQAMTVKALRRETLQHAGQAVETTVLSALMDGMETLSWMDSDGTMIRQTTPFGWTMESSNARDAMSAGSKGGATDDLLAALAVPIQGDSSLLASRPSVTLRLKGVTLTRQQLETHRQEIVSLGTNLTEMTVRADSLPASGCPREAIPADLAPWLAPSAFIQSADARMVDKARDITGNWTNSLEAALAIYRWVNTTVTKTPVVSLPSALDVLLKPEGDCNEHTYLFVALARATGLPARIRVGLTLHEGRFYYHAWPSVYVGRWLDMDPTRGLPAVNAGYISLVEGELAEQMKLMSVIGQLKVEIP
jgi:hypothetical protein